VGLVTGRGLGEGRGHVERDGRAVHLGSDGTNIGPIRREYDMDKPRRAYGWWVRGADVAWRLLIRAAALLSEHVGAGLLTAVASPIELPAKATAALLAVGMLWAKGVLGKLDRQQAAPLRAIGGTSPH
jgi:hypothetical protein